MKLKTLLATLIIFLIPFSLYGQKAYDFLRIDMSARAGALGGSFVSNNDDPNVIFYNPAGLKLINGNKISFLYVRHLLDINLAGVSFSKEVDGLGRIGVAIQYINYGSFTEADKFGNKIGDFNAGEFALTFGYANSFEKNFNYGANIKFINSSIASQTSSAVAFDFGLQYVIPNKGINIGVSLTNAGFQLSKYFSSSENLPIDLSIGISKKIEHMPLTLSLDFHKLTENSDPNISAFESFAIGAEFKLSRSFFLRFGYNNQKRKELKIGNFGGLAGFNTGLGFIISKYNFDYGYSSMGDIGSLHRITISTSL